MPHSESDPVEQRAREVPDPQDDRVTVPQTGPSHISLTIWLDAEPECHTDLAWYLTRAALIRVVETGDALEEAEMQEEEVVDEE